MGGLIAVAIGVTVADVIAILSQWLNEKSKKIVLFLLVMLYGVLFTTRSFEFPDTESYYLAFQDFSNISSSFEPLNVILIKIFRLFPFGFRLLCFFYTVLNEVILIKFIKKIYEENNIYEKNNNRGVLFSILIIVLASYFSYFGFLYNGTIMRQGVSMGLLLLAFIYSHKKNRIKAILCYVLAMLFHYSAVIGLIIWLVSLIKIKKRSLYFVWYGAVIAIWGINFSIKFYEIIKYFLLFLCNFFSFLQRYAYYLVTTNNIRTDGMYSLKDILFLLIGLFFLLQINMENTIQKKLINVYMFGITVMELLNCFYLGYRFYDYFLLFVSGIIAVLYQRQNKIITKQFGLIVIVISAIALIAVVRFLQSV